MFTERCPKCGVENAPAYARDKTCKDCRKNLVRQRRYDPATRDRILEYDRQRGNRQGPDYMRAVRERDPVAYKARNAVSNAVRDGRLLRPDQCSHCHTKCRPHGHHEDYSKPLDVVWLCAACHRQFHALKETVAAALSGTR